MGLFFNEDKSESSSLMESDFQSASSSSPETDTFESSLPTRPSCRSRCYQVMIAGSPDLAPLPWACINFVCLLWSALLVFAIHQTEGPLERVFGTQLYLIWNLVTTIIWCFEVGLIILYRKSKSTEPDDDIQGEVLDAVINAFAYLYQFVDSLYLFSQRVRREQNEAVESLSDALMRNNAEDFN